MSSTFGAIRFATLPPGLSYIIAVSICHKIFTFVV
jgi:hypothetical protein